MFRKKFNVRKLAISGVLGALSIILGLTPIGFIPVGPTRATIMHIPVIIGAVVEGPVVGGLIGLIFGLSSLFQAITNPTPVSFVFLNPLVSILPRIIIGITSYYAFKAMNKLGNKKTAALINVLWAAIAGYLVYGIYSSAKSPANAWMIIVNLALLAFAAVMAYFTNSNSVNKYLDVAVAAIVGTLTNTVLVLSMIYLIYAENFVKALGMDAGQAGKVILGIGITNGIPETVVAIILVTSIVSVLRKRDTLQR